MSLTTSPTQQALNDSERWFAYSGPKQGDISVPATIELINIPNVGLRDTFVKIKPYFDARIANDALHTGLGISVLIDGEEVYKQRYNVTSNLETLSDNEADPFELFIPRQSKLEIFSLNTSNNNLQYRGCTVLGWYL